MQRLHNVPLTLGYSVQRATLVDPVWSHCKTLNILCKSKWKVQSVTFKSNPCFSWCVKRIAKVCSSLRYSWTWSLTVNVRAFRIDYPCLFYYQPAATATTVAIHQKWFCTNVHLSHFHMLSHHVSVKAVWWMYPRCNNEAPHCHWVTTCWIVLSEALGTFFFRVFYFL